MDNARILSGVNIRSILFQIIRQCNYRCNHCSQDAPHVDSQQLRPVSSELVKFRLEMLKTGGLQRVRFTGGEPLLHPELPRIVQIANGLALEASIVTNGSLLLNRVDALVEAGIRSVWISLYGTSATTYSVLTGRNAPVQSLCDAIGILVSNGVKVGIYCPISLIDDHLDISLLNKITIRGVTHVKFMQFMEQGRQIEAMRSDSSSQRRTALERIRTYGVENPKIKVSVSMRSGQLEDFIEKGFGFPKNLECTAGNPDSWSMTTDGELKPCCLMMPKVENTLSVREKDAVPLHFFPLALTSTDPARNTCPALPRYVTRSTERFICPLSYAVI